MTKGKSSSKINFQALIAVAVAGFLMYLFLFFNFFIFDTLGITIASFQVAGAILLFLLGMQMTLDIDIGRVKEHPKTAAGSLSELPCSAGRGLSPRSCCCQIRTGCSSPPLPSLLL
jgi:multiple antibiotic resistance protein